MINYQSLPSATSTTPKTSNYQVPTYSMQVGLSMQDWDARLYLGIQTSQTIVLVVYEHKTSHCTDKIFRGIEGSRSLCTL